MLLSRTVSFETDTVQNLTGLLGMCRSLKIATFTTETYWWREAMESLYKRALQGQSQLNEANQYEEQSS